MVTCPDRTLINHQTRNVLHRIATRERKVDISDLKEVIVGHRLDISNLLLNMAKHRLTIRATKAAMAHPLADL